MVGAKRLTDIDLSSNHLSGSLPALPATIQTADFSNNAFAGNVPLSYGASLVPFPSLSQLTHVSICHCQTGLKLVIFVFMSLMLFWLPEDQC